MPHHIRCLTGILAAFLLLVGLGVSTAAADPAPVPAPVSSATPKAPTSPFPAAASPAASQPPKDDTCDVYVGWAKTICEKGLRTFKEVREQGGSVADAAKAAAGEVALAPAKGVLAKFSPTNAIGEVAKTFAESGVGYLQAVGNVLHGTTRYDPGAGWFLKQYAISFGLALFLMVFVLLWTVGRASRAGADREEAFKAVFAYFPLTLLLASFGPAVAMELAKAVDALSLQAAQAAGADAKVFLERAVQTFHDLDPAHLLGGVGTLLIFGIWSTLAAIVLFFELVAREFGLYLSSFFMPFALAFLINPRARQVTSRALGLWLTLMVIKPMIFLTFGLMWAAAAGIGSMGGVSEEFSTIMFLLAGATLVAATPIMVVKYAPAMFDQLGWTTYHDGRTPAVVTSAGRAMRSKVTSKMKAGAGMAAAAATGGAAAAGKGAALAAKGAAKGTGTGLKATGAVFDPDVQMARQAFRQWSGRAASPAARAGTVARPGPVDLDTGEEGGQ